MRTVFKSCPKGIPSFFTLHSSLFTAPGGKFPGIFPLFRREKYWFLNLTLYHRFFPRSSLKNVQKRPISSVGFRHISRIALFNCIHANFPCFFCEIMIKFSVKKYANNWGKPVFFRRIISRSRNRKGPEILCIPPPMYGPKSSAIWKNCVK